MLLFWSFSFSLLVHNDPKQCPFCCVVPAGTLQNQTIRSLWLFDFAICRDFLVETAKFEEEFRSRFFRGVFSLRFVGSLHRFDGRMSDKKPLFGVHAHHGKARPRPASGVVASQVKLPAPAAHAASAAGSTPAREPRAAGSSAGVAQPATVEGLPADAAAAPRPVDATSSVKPIHFSRWKGGPPPRVVNRRRKTPDVQSASSSSSRSTDADVVRAAGRVRQPPPPKAYTLPAVVVPADPLDMLPLHLDAMPVYARQLLQAVPAGGASLALRQRKAIIQRDNAIFCSPTLFAALWHGIFAPGALDVYNVYDIGPLALAARHDRVSLFGHDIVARDELLELRRAAMTHVGVARQHKDKDFLLLQRQRELDIGRRHGQGQFPEPLPVHGPRRIGRTHQGRVVGHFH